MAMNDDVLKMFFDEDFVPQAYVDVLLSSQNTQLNELRVVSSSLLSRLDYYTGRLTKELEVSIQNLQKPAESLSYLSPISESGQTTKLEYYLDTLGNSVKTLEDDVFRVSEQLLEMKAHSQESEATIQKIRDLENVSSKLTKVLQVFEKIKSFVVITLDASKGDEGLQNIRISDFEVSLKTMADAILSSLRSSTGSELSSYKNQDLLQKISMFIELKPMFMGLTKFYPAYSEFVDQIKAGMQLYLREKDIDGEFVA